jgi:hypothetical protein
MARNKLARRDDLRTFLAEFMSVLPQAKDPHCMGSPDDRMGGLRSFG